MGKKKILVVDDEADIRASLEELLLHAGFEIETAKDGAELLQKLPKFKPNLIILDRIMPGLKTHEIAAEMKEMNYTTPIVILSVVQFTDQMRDLMPSSMADYIEKPFDNKDFLNRVKKALAQ